MAISVRKSVMELHLGMLTWEAPTLLHKSPRVLCKEAALGCIPGNLLQDVL